MNGGLTVMDLEALKAKAAALDEALAYLKGRCDSETLIAVERILRGATPEGTVKPIWRA